MAVKGDRARLEPLAMRLYAEGQSLTALEEQLGVSRQTMAEWKASTKKPSDELDEWDKARARRIGYEERLHAIREDLLKKLEESIVGAEALPSPALVDSLSKMDALLDRHRRAAREAADAAARLKSEMFLGVIRDLVEYGRARAPELVAALEENFDDLVQWGRGKYGGQ